MAVIPWSWFLLKEDGDYLLQENGDRIILERQSTVGGLKKMGYSGLYSNTRRAGLYRGWQS